MHWRRWCLWSKQRCCAGWLHEICHLLFHICCLYGEWNSYIQNTFFFSISSSSFEASANPDAMKSMKWNTSWCWIKRQTDSQLSQICLLSTAKKSFMSNLSLCTYLCCVWHKAAHQAPDDNHASSRTCPQALSKTLKLLDFEPGSKKPHRHKEGVKLTERELAFSVHSVVFMFSNLQMHLVHT